MRYRIIKRGDGRFQPVYKRLLLWRFIADPWGDPVSYHTELCARVRITRYHCNWLNDTAGRRIKWGRGLTPKVKA